MSTEIDTKAIDRKKYPELDLLLWDINALMVDGKFAFWQAPSIQDIYVALKSNSNKV